MVQPVWGTQAWAQMLMQRRSRKQSECEGAIQKDLFLYYIGDLHSGSVMEMIFLRVPTVN